MCLDEEKKQVAGERSTRRRWSGEGFTVWLLTSRENSRRSSALFWVALTILCALRAYIGLYGTRLYSHDAFMVLDGAWRMMHGQRPHVDFNSMIGPVAYLPTVVGLKLSGMTAEGFGYGQALAGFATGAWAYALGAKLGPKLRVGFALLTAAITVSPAIIGPTPFSISPGMTYNRLIYGLLSVLLLESWEGEGKGGQRFVAGLSTGVALTLMTFTKITGLVIGGGLVVVLAMVYPKSRARWFGLISGIVCAALPVLLYLRLQLWAVVQDLRLTAAAKHVAVSERYDLNTIFLEAGMALALIFGMRLFLRGAQKSPEANRLGMAALAVLGFSVLLIFGNFQRAELPLAMFLLLLALQVCINHGRQRSNEAVLQLATVGTAVYVGSAFFGLVFSLLLGVHSKLGPAQHDISFVTPALRAFAPINDDYFYSLRVNDGLRLLEQNRRPGERVMCLDFTNPFSFGLQLPPAPGGSTNLQYRGSFDAKHYVPAWDLFGQADLVMEPVAGDDPNLTEGLNIVYSAYLHQHFDLVATTKIWRLYRKKQPRSVQE